MKCLKIVFLVFIELTISFSIGCKKDDSGKYNITYTFTGDASATVYYFNSSDDEVSESVTPPWSYKFSTSDENHYVKLSAFSLGSGSATVTISLNGVVKKSGSDGGSYGFNATTGTYQIKDL